jgi:hypothetical protein
MACSDDKNLVSLSVSGSEIGGMKARVENDENSALDNNKKRDYTV